MSSPPDSPALSPLKRALLAIEQLEARLAAAERHRGEPIAVVGLGCRFPGGADTPEAFWRLLAEGGDAVTEVPASRWPAEAYFDADPDATGRMNTRHGAFLADIEGFDPAFFGISPREAASMDPQHRLLLEVAWEALAAAGQLRDRLAGNATGIFLGITTVEYGQLQLAAEGLAALDAYHITGNALNAAAGRLAYVFGLQGPCLAVDTACSSSLVAVHLACASLRAGECSSALAGGVNLMLSPHGSIALAKGRVLSPSGRARAFDAAADGMVRGEGCGMLVLKRRSDAERDGDRILALIRGSGVNQDGPSSGLTVPNGPAQEALLRRVLETARVEPQSVDYLEAHGTGTPLGDPIEAGAAGAVYGRARAPGEPLWIGSVKTNIGHLEAAAGVAGLIKAILALHHGSIPPHLHFRDPSPHIPWESWRLRVPTAPTPWPRAGRPRRAAVSAFGFSGTNAHVLVEEAPVPPLAGDARGLAAPPSPFRRERIPLPRAAAPRGPGPEEPAAHPLVGRPIALAGTTERRFESELSAASPSFLADHRVFGAVVLPAAAYLEMFLAAGRNWLSGAGAEVRELEILEPMAFAAAAARRIQTVLQPDERGGAEARVFSAAGTSGEWTLHAAARLRRAEYAGAAGEPLAEARRRCDRDFPVARLYGGYAGRGLDYGPAFTAVRSLALGSGEALAEIALAPGVSPASFEAHPALLDACLQAAGAGLGDSGSDEVYLPVGASAASWRAGVSLASGWAHVRWRLAGGEITIDARIFGPEGSEAGRLEGMILRRASRAALERALRAPAAGWLHQLSWLPVAGAPEEAGPEGAWLVLADAAGVGQALAARLRAAGGTVSVVPADMAPEALAPRLAAEPAWRGIVHLGALDSGSAGEISGRLLDLVQALAADGRAFSLWIATAGAVAADGAGVRPEAAAAWGLGRVLMSEDPEWNCRLVDVGDEADAVERLFAECIRPDHENQIAWRGGRRLGARIEPLAAPAARPPALRADGAYLVTGGLGALGLLTAAWLIRRGARRVALAGRSGPSPAARAQLAAWREAGFQVSAHAADVSDRAALAALLAALAAEGRPLRGLVHAAGVLEDGTLRQQTRPRFARVLAPKSDAAELLDQLTRDLPLDFFVLFSSSAAVLGTPGQANYAAANACLDALAHRRRAEGRPGLSVNWGPWTAGMALGGSDRLEARGVGAIDPAAGFELLERLLASGTAQALVLPISWKPFLAAFEGAIPPLFAALPEYGAPAAPAAASPADPLGDPEGFLRGEIARVLRLPAERIGDRPLTVLGLDSLLAVELRNRIRKFAGIDLPVTAFLEGKSVAQLAAELRRRAPAETSAAEAAAPAASIWPLSSGQEALWFLHQADPGSAAYNTAFALRLRGAFDGAVLDRVLCVLAARHPLLRASFPRVDGMPALVVAEGLALAAERVDASGWSEAELSAAVSADYARPFDLERGPLARATLFQRSGGEQILLCAIHHIVADAWTNWLLLDEFSRLYSAESGGPPAALEAPEATYADFGRWQRELAGGPEGGRLWEYWLGRLSGELPVLALPTDHPRPAVLAPRGDAVPLELPPALMARLADQARARGATPFALLLAAWMVWLHRHTGQDDVIVGAPTTGRSRPEFAGVAGYFANPVPLRASLAGSPAFPDFLEQVRRGLLGALAHADLPLPLLIERLGLARDPSRPALFQTLFVYQKSQAAGAAGRLSGLAAEEFPLVQMAGQFELMLEIFEGGAASLKYNTALFGADTVRRFARRFRALLEGIAADPDRAVADLPVMDEGERSTVVRAWNATPASYPQDLCLHQLVAAQAARTPGAVAVRHGEQDLTYAELDARANQLAHWLRRAGAGPDVPVGVCAERSAELVIALLAVLKSGSAYVPFDPSYPRDRLDFMREDSGARVILTQERLAAEWGGGGTRLLRLDADWPEVAAEPASAPAAGVAPDHLAYIIYTSGSTGRPKGAGNSHRAIVNRLLWMQDAYRLGPADRVLQKTPFSFDVSVWEFFWPLLTGARLVLARPGGHQDAAYLAGVAAREEITTLHFVPSMLQVFVDEPGLAGCRALRQVFCSGEALPAELAARFLARHPAELHNLYGPTEAAVDVSFWRCERGDRRPTIPIGRPIARTQLYVLDRRGRPAPIGVAGELHIGGIGLARGYHRRPDLTAEKFIPDPFGPPGARLYRTGDLARWLPEGAIEYLGRLDHQVKLRGFRIELGEIEAALARQPGVRDAAVLLREDRPGDRLLAAYVTGAAGASPEPAALRAGLRAALPDHMVPADLMVLPAFPLTPSGKVDRRALPAPERIRPAGEAAAPATETERRIAGVWREVLGREQLGVLDNFFDVGGHSLRLGQVHARLRTLLPHPPALMELFQYPTIRALAARIDGTTAGAAAGGERGQLRQERRVGQQRQRARREQARTDAGEGAAP